MSAKTIIISNKLRAPDYLGIDSYAWGSSRPSIENYEMAILDLDFGEPVPQVGYVQLSGEGAENIHICVVRTCHLYDLWLETLKGLPVQSVFDKLFNCEGIYEARPSP